MNRMMRRMMLMGVGRNATTIIPVDTLPADGNPPVVWFNGGVWVYENSEWKIGSIDVGGYTVLAFEDGRIATDDAYKIGVLEL